MTACRPHRPSCATRASGRFTTSESDVLATSAPFTTSIVPVRATRALVDEPQRYCNFRCRVTGPHVPQWFSSTAFSGFKVNLSLRCSASAIALSLSRLFLINRLTRASCSPVSPEAQLFVFCGPILLIDDVFSTVTPSCHDRQLSHLCHCRLSVVLRSCRWPRIKLSARVFRVSNLTSKLFEATGFQNASVISAG